MTPLTEYVVGHTHIVGKDEQAEAGDVDLVFFHVRAIDEPDAEELKRLMAEELGPLEVDVLDGREYSFVLLGDILLSYEFALRLMGLGAALGLWKVLSPKTVMPDLPEQHALALAKSGLVTIAANKQGDSR